MAVTVSLRVASVLYSRSDPEGPCSGGTASTDVADLRAVVNQSDRQLLACAVLRRRFSSGCKPHPATAPAGSNRSSYGGDEMAEAFG
jgi:hypothetical protein